MLIGLDQYGCQPKKNEQATHVRESGDDDAGRHCGISSELLHYQGNYRAGYTAKTTANSDGKKDHETEHQRLGALHHRGKDKHRDASSDSGQRAIKCP
jgi:hypothetical protein